MNNTTKEILEKVFETYPITIKDLKQSIKLIRNIVKNYVKTNNIKTLVIGISGGLDSAIVAALCQQKYTGVPLIGLSIPLNNSIKHKNYANIVGNMYCDIFKEFKEWENQENNNSFYNNMFNILNQNNDILNQLNINNIPTNILQGNMKARLRMITLYDLAKRTNGIVLSTDNYSEYLMGFWTICGDVGDLAPIQQLFKGLELPIIAKILNIPNDIITQPPSDGLMTTQDDTDEAQLGTTYKYIDLIMYIYFLRTTKHIKEWNIIKKDPLVISIINKYKNTEYKRKGCINIFRNQIDL